MLLIQDAELQKQTGDHLYNAARYAILPKSVISMLYVLFILLFFGMVYLYIKG